MEKQKLTGVQDTGTYRYSREPIACGAHRSAPAVYMGLTAVNLMCPVEEVLTLSIGRRPNGGAIPSCTAA